MRTVERLLVRPSCHPDATLIRERIDNAHLLPVEGTRLVDDLGVTIDEGTHAAGSRLVARAERTPVGASEHGDGSVRALRELVHQHFSATAVGTSRLDANAPELSIQSLLVAP